MSFRSIHRSINRGKVKITINTVDIEEAALYCGENAYPNFPRGFTSISSHNLRLIKSV